MPSVKKYKICRRLGTGMFEKCQTQRFAMSETKRAGAAKGRRRPRRSDYGVQLIEKQKVRMSYGVSEKQFRNYVNKALLTASPATTLFELLESRLDNVVYRLGLAPTRRMARQLTTHGHLTFNGKRIDVPSAHMREGDVVAARGGSKKIGPFTDLDAKLKQHTSPGWMKFDQKALSATITGTPANPDPFLNFQAVIEFYSR